MKPDAKRVAVFHPEFRGDLRHWVKHDRATAIRVLDLAEAVIRDPSRRSENRNRSSMSSRDVGPGASPRSIGWYIASTRNASIFFRLATIIDAAGVSALTSAAVVGPFEIACFLGWLPGRHGTQSPFAEGKSGLGLPIARRPLENVLRRLIDRYFPASPSIWPILRPRGANSLLNVARAEI